MLLIVRIPRDIEYGGLFANNHLVFKTLWTLTVMTEACKITINYNVLKMNFDMSWAFLHSTTLTLELKVSYSS
jgi:hypothetical protein